MSDLLDRVNEVARSACRESERMLAALAQRGDDARVFMTAGQFRRLAHLLRDVGVASSQCGGSDCLGAPVDGVRLWVTCDRLTREQARAAELAAVNRELSDSIDLARLDL